MTVETLKKAMLPLNESLKQPQNPELFKTAMDVLQEALDEEEKFSGGVPMWHGIVNLPTKPAPTRENINDWACGKKYPEDPEDVVRKIFNHLRRHKVEVPEPTRVRRERNLAQQEGRTFVEPENAPQPEGVGYYADLLLLLLQWAPQPGVAVPFGWIQLLVMAGQVLSRDVLEGVICKIKGLSLGKIDAWIQGARDPALAQQMAWPSPEAQAVLVKHLISFFLAMEFKRPTEENAVVLARIQAAAKILSEHELETVTQLVRSKAEPPGSWEVFTAQYLAGILAGALPLPHAALVQALCKELMRAMKPHFVNGEWP